MNRRHPDSQLDITSGRRSESHSPLSVSAGPGAAKLRTARAAAIVAALAFGVLPLCGGGTVRAANLPLDLRTSTTLAPANKDTIKAYVDDHVAKMAGTDLPAASKARDALISEVQSGAVATQQPSAAFLDNYAQAINSGLQAQAKSPDLRIRLNTAIIVAKVAQKADNARLAPITTTLLADSSDAVVSWAAKAAGSELFWVLSQLPATAKGDPLLTALVAAAKKPKADGMVVQNVYAALNIGAPPNTPGAVWTKVVGFLVPEAQGLIRARVDSYKDGMPNDPAVEKYGLAFLARKDVWSNQNPAQQATTSQLLVDTIAYAGQRLAAAPQAAHRGLQVAVNEAGKNMWVVGDTLGSAPLKAAVTPLMTANAPVPQVISAAAANFDAVKKIFQTAKIDLKQPAALAPIPSTQSTESSAPAAAPTTTTTTRSS